MLLDFKHFFYYSNSQRAQEGGGGGAAQRQLLLMAEKIRHCRSPWKIRRIKKAPTVQFLHTQSIACMHTMHAYLFHYPAACRSRSY